MIHDSMFPRYSLLPWTCHVSVMIPEWKHDDMFPLHFCQRNIIVACFRYVSLYGFKLLPSSKTYIYKVLYSSYTTLP